MTFKLLVCRELSFVMSKYNLQNNYILQDKLFIPRLLYNIFVKPKLNLDINCLAS